MQNVFQRIQSNKLALLASLCFFLGSMLFLPVFVAYSTIGVWLFMTGSALMAVDILTSSPD